MRMKSVSSVSFLAERRRYSAFFTAVRIIDTLSIDQTHLFVFSCDIFL